MSIAFNSSSFIATSQNLATLEIVRKLAPNYDFFQKNPFATLGFRAEDEVDRTGRADCKATSLMLVALNPELLFVKHVTGSARPTQRTAASYVHYLTLDPVTQTVMHSTGAPLTADGAHIKAVHASDFATGWSEAGERQAKPKSGVAILEELCEGSREGSRSFSKYKTRMSIEDPAEHLKHGSLENLREEMLNRYSSVV